MWVEIIFIIFLVRVRKIISVQEIYSDSLFHPFPSLIKQPTVISQHMGKELIEVQVKSHPFCSHNQPTSIITPYHVESTKFQVKNGDLSMLTP